MTDDMMVPPPHVAMVPAPVDVILPLGDGWPPTPPAMPLGDGWPPTPPAMHGISQQHGGTVHIPPAYRHASLLWAAHTFIISHMGLPDP